MPTPEDPPAGCPPAHRRLPHPARPLERGGPGGPVEHCTDEAGQGGLQRRTGHCRRSIGINPGEEARRGWTQSIGLVERLMGRRMFPLTLDGLDRGIRALSR